MTDSVSGIFSDQKVRVFLSCILIVACLRSAPYTLVCWYDPIKDLYGQKFADTLDSIVYNGVFVWGKMILVIFDTLLMLVAYPLIGWRLRSMTLRRRQQTRGIRLAVKKLTNLFSKISKIDLISQFFLEFDGGNHRRRLHYCE